MSAIASMITLDSCITDYLDESEQGIHKYKKLFNIAFRGMDNMGLDFFYQIRSMKLPVSATKTVTLPADYVKYTKIGVLNSIGEVIPLKFNQKLTLFADSAPERLQVTQDDTLDFQNIYNQASPFFYNYYNNGAYTTLYGVPSGSPFVGNFNIDEANGIILLNENFFYDYLILEYITGPVEGQDYYIPVQFREALIAWMAWHDIKSIPSTRRGSISDKAERKSNFYNARRLANARYKPFYLAQAYELNLEMQRLCVKA